MSCISFASWMPYALLAMLVLGVLLGSFIRLGIDRAELAAYRCVSRDCEFERGVKRNKQGLWP